MEKILLGHGSGGRLMHQLIRDHFAPEFGMTELNDAAVVDFNDAAHKLAFTTDSYVVSPIFFPGGDIGELAVNGTVNDLAMAGSKPLYLTAGFIIEEGFLMDDLRRIVSSMSDAAKKANVRIIAGDTKVVDRGKGDGIFINTSGVGIIPDGIDLGAHKIEEGDKVIISGLMGSHGIAVMSERNGLVFDPPIHSDTAPLNGLVDLMFDFTTDVRIMRDPTRGGVATTLKEISLEAGCCITLYEKMLPVAEGVKGACELLGLDPLYVANEGILIAIVPYNKASSLVERMRTHSFGRNAVIIGEAGYRETRNSGMVLLQTAIGGTRIIDMLAGEQLPRIC